MPWKQQVKGRHRGGKPGVEIRPDPMHDLLEMSDEREHRQHGLDEYTVVPLAPSIKFEVGRIALRGMERRVAQDNHPPLNIIMIALLTALTLSCSLSSVLA